MGSSLNHIFIANSRLFSMAGTHAVAVAGTAASAAAPVGGQPGAGASSRPGRGPSRYWPRYPAGLAVGGRLAAVRLHLRGVRCHRHYRLGGAESLGLLASGAGRYTKDDTTNRISINLTGRLIHRPSRLLDSSVGSGCNSAYPRGAPSVQHPQN